MDRRLLRGCFLLLLGVAPAVSETSTVAEEIGSVQVFLTVEQALARAFPEATGFDVESLATLDGDSAHVYIARDSTAILQGYAVVDEEIGKYRPITFLVATDASLRVRDVSILVYRESRGGEVRRQRYLRQYRGKQVDDPIRINRDIINITGATLSVRALNTGVRRSLQLLQVAYADTL